MITIVITELIQGLIKFVKFLIKLLILSGIDNLEKSLLKGS